MDAPEHRPGPESSAFAYPLLSELALGTVPQELEKLLLDLKYLGSLRLLARGIAHDYNNILAGLAGQLDLLGQDGIGNLEKRRRQGMVSELLERGGIRTEVLVSFAGIQADDSGRVSVNRLGRRLGTALESMSSRHRLESSGDGGQLEFDGRLSELVPALFYLVENSVQAVPDGGSIRLQSTVTGAGDEKVIEITIGDFGPGFPAGLLEQLCRPFVTTRAAAGHYGLGLYACQALIRRHGGSLSLFNPERGGAEAKIRLPASRPQTGVLDASHASVEPPVDRSRHPLGRRGFLVVEDDRAMRDLIVSGLKKRGHLVFQAAGCQEALTEFRQVQRAVEIILIDVGLTDGDGIACAEKLLKINDSPAVITMSGLQIDPEQLPGHRFKFLKKPFTLKQIEELVHEFQEESQR